MSGNEIRTEERRQRTLTDDDVDALAESLRKKIVQEFYKDLGRSVWGLIWKTLVLAAIGIAGAASLKGSGGT